MAEKTVIQIKRSSGQFKDKKDTLINYGEPNFLKSNEKLDYNDILAFGNKNVENTLEKATFFEGHNNPDLIGNGVYFNQDKVIIDKTGKSLKTNSVAPTYTNPSKNDKKYWILTCDEDGKVYAHTQNGSPQDSNGVYVSSNHVLNGGAWNDYAERRECISGEAGDVVCEQGDGTLGLSKEKLQALPYVISDTFGMVIGNRDKTYKPIAVSGRVLVKVNCETKVGDVLCADKDGFATKMTRTEIANYPDRILGIVSEVPTYKVWNDIEINNRVWITIK